MQKEIEAKFLDIDKSEIRSKLQKLNFELLQSERLMKRKSFHFEDDMKSGRKRWARVRDEGDKITMTVKEVRVESDINGVYESEIVIDSFEQGISLFKSLGMIETAYQETYREEWIKDDVHIAIDTWPHLNPYIEIEALEESSVRFFSKELGFEFEDALFGGVDVVYSKVHNIDRITICKAPLLTFDLSLEEILAKVK